MAREPIIPCIRPPEFYEKIADYAEALRQQAPSIGRHGLTEDEFWKSGLFRGAIEKLRGTQAATTKEKTQFVSTVLDYLKDNNLILDWVSRGGKERHDFEIRMNDQHICVVEAKGCLDGNNTTIFERPSNANEFVIWSLCQNSAADPDKNAWSGLHTRLSPALVKNRQQEQVDAVVIWDMLCGTAARICPKIRINPDRTTKVGTFEAPPPCIYLLPRTIPNAKTNPKPPCHTLDELPFLKTLHRAFAGDNTDLTQVYIEVRGRKDGELERRTIFVRESNQTVESNWTRIKRTN